MKQQIHQVKDQEIRIHFPSISAASSSSSDGQQNNSPPSSSSSAVRNIHSLATKKLFEISGDLLRDIEAGAQLTIKGSDKEEAVLCTSNKTFTLKKCETSNSVFLIPPSSSSSFCIEALSREYFEVKPRVKNVKELAERMRFLVEEENLLSLQDLVDAMTLSEKEVQELIPAMGARVSSHGYIVLFSKNQLREAYRLLFDRIVAERIALKSIPLDFLDNLFSSASFSLPPDSLTILREMIVENLKSSGEQTSVVSFDPLRVARVGALLVLLTHKGFLEKEKFLAEWSALTPEVGPAQPDLTALANFLAEKKGPKTMVIYDLPASFPPPTLPASEFFYTSLLL